MNLIKKLMKKKDEVVEKVVVEQKETCANCSPEVTDCSECKKGAVVEE